MNLVKLHGLAALTTLCVLAVILVAAGGGDAAPRGSLVVGAGSASNRMSTGQAGEAADRGIGGCTALLGAHQAVSNYPRIRAQFARSPWPDLRAAGMSYVDLIVALQTARADGYETAWFYQRLSLACARHGRDHLSEGTRVNETARAV
jgi:hypothetical protein